MAKETNEISISIKASNDASKTSDVKEIMTLYQKTKQSPIIVIFIMILGGFLWILAKNKQKEDNFIV